MHFFTQFLTYLLPNSQIKLEGLQYWGVLFEWKELLSSSEWVSLMPTTTETMFWTPTGVSCPIHSILFQSNVSGDSLPSTPSSSSTEDHLNEFEDHALQYAVKSLKNL